METDSEQTQHNELQHDEKQTCSDAFVNYVDILTCGDPLLLAQGLHVLRVIPMSLTQGVLISSLTASNFLASSWCK